MNNFAIEQIDCLLALVETGSFQKASQSIYKAKSAIMYSINALEQQLSFPLLDRSGYRVRLTKQGLEFYQQALEFRKQIQLFQQQTEQIASNIESKLKMSVSGIYGMQPVYKIIKETIALFPQTEFYLEREILSGEQMLIRGLVDIAIFERVHNQTEIDFKKIDEILLKLVVSKEHPFLNLPKDERTLENLNKFPQIIQRSTIPDETKAFGVQKNAIKWKVTDTLSKKEIILNGLGWGRLPAEMIKDEIKRNKLIHLEELLIDQPLEVFLCRRKGENHGKVAQFIWDSL